MTLENFISVLALSAAVTSVCIEIIKTLFNKFNIKYNPSVLATITAFVLGILEVFVYYHIHYSGITVSAFIYALCMGFTNTLASTVGYDKTREFLLALLGGRT